MTSPDRFAVFAQTQNAAFCLLCVSLLCACSIASPGAQQVFIGDTSYTGIRQDDGGVQAFLGVPFAAPPTGARRWLPPQPVAQRDSIDATRFAPACMQGRHMVDWYRDVVQRFGGDAETFPVPGLSEDCLYLNIWTPAADADAGLPVMVWIHGGSHTGGWSYEPNYIGDALAHHGVVVVSIAYRLDVFGFFSHPELPVSNFGLLDQIAALTWVRDNIAWFGGNPANVTVFGESAGAASIGYLLASPLAQGLFQRAIHQSAGYELLNVDRRDDFLPQGLEIQQRLDNGGEAGRGNIDQLRTVGAARLLEAARTVYGDAQPNVVIDGNSLVEPPSVTLGSGRMAAVDLIIGSNADEWKMYLDDDTSVADTEAWLRENDPGHADELRAVLAGSGGPQNQLDRLITGQQFVCPSLAMARNAVVGGKRAWVYRFSRVRPGAKSREVGAYHGAEIPYVFDKHDAWLPIADADRALGAAMAAYWTRFARSGDPNAGGRPAWPAYGPAGQDAIDLGTEIRTGRHPDVPLCALLGSP